MQEAMSDLDPVAIDPVTHALAGAFRRSPIAMVVFSAAGIVEHANDAMARLLDVTAASLIGRTVDSVVHPDDVEMIGRFAEFDSDREPVALDHRVIRSDGEVRWLRSTVVALARGETHSFFVQSIDHTASRRQDIQLRSIDAVTGLLSRDGLMSKFDDLLAAHRGRSIAPYALFAVDIDDFRGVNDRLGPPAADRALYLVGACIRAALPVGVAVARRRSGRLRGPRTRDGGGEATLAVERLLAGLTESSIGLGLPVLGYKLGAVAVAGSGRRSGGRRATGRTAGPGSGDDLGRRRRRDHVGILLRPRVVGRPIIGGVGMGRGASRSRSRRARTSPSVNPFGR